MIRLVRAPQTYQLAGIPAVPGVPARPARRYWTEPAPYSGIWFLGPADARIVTQADGTPMYQLDWVRVTGTIAFRSGNSVGLVGGTVSSMVTVPGSPAIPGTPAVAAQTVVVGANGWAAGGRTLQRMDGNGALTLRFTTVVAALAGLARPGSSYGFGVPLFAWYRHGSVAEVVESGRTVYSQPAPSGSPVYTVARMGGQIEYRIDGALVYTSEAYDSAPLVGYGTPYAVGDSVLATIESANAIQGSLPALVGRLGTLSNRIQGAIPALAGAIVSTNAGRIAGTLPAIAGRLGNWSGIRGSIPALTGELRGEPSFVVNSVYAVLPPISGFLTGIQGVSGRISGQLPVLRAAIWSEAGGGRIRGTLPLVRGSLIESAPPIVPEVLPIGDFAILESALLLVTLDGLDVSSSATLTLILELSTVDGLELSDLAGVGSLVELLTMDGVRVSGGIRVAGGSFVGGSVDQPSSDGIAAILRGEALQYAVNLATGALSTYTGFDFAGFVRVDGATYGWRKDGLYRIGEATDSGSMIQALVDFGASDMGTAQAKRISMAWLGLRTDGGVYLRMRADSGTEYVYRAKEARDTYRAALAKGVTGRQWNMQLVLEDASYAALDSIEVEIATTQRRFNSR